MLKTRNLEKKKSKNENKDYHKIKSWKVLKIIKNKYEEET
jgi:hypothetical protein